MSARRGRWGVPVRLGRYTGERYAADLRWLSLGPHELLRRVALVLRDRAWRTPDPVATRVRRTTQGFVIGGTTRVERTLVDWSLRVDAADDALNVGARITPRRDVDVNRAGLVVLLDAGAWSGARYEATHRSDGRRTRGRLPREVAPHQPLLDLAAVRIASDGLALDLAFAGDVFEMEDQRNWLDPTFKLYSRDLALPIPYALRAGESIEQHVRLVAHAQAGAAPRRATSRRLRGRIPALGIATAPARVPRRRGVVEAVRALAPAFVLHRTDGHNADLRQAAALATALRVPLHVEAIGAAASATTSIAAARPARVALHLADERDVGALRRALPQAELAGGTFSDFVMVNRNGMPGWAQRATFALTPTVHAHDDRSLVETLAALPDVLARARAVAGELPLDVGPCTLRRRLVPRTGEPLDQRIAGVPADVDPRQHRAIAAAWLASAIALAGTAGVETFCAFEAAGARGLLEGVDASRAARVFAALARARGERVEILAMAPATGGAFVVGPALWLVDLAGRRVGRDAAYSIRVVDRDASAERRVREWMRARS
jgi:hypothetical protein